MGLSVHLYVNVDTGSDEITTFEVYHSSITHNLAPMAKDAGIYEALWRPEEVPYNTAGELTVPLWKGLQKLKSNPEHYKQFDSPNGWGVYEHFVPFVEKYLEACKEHPKTLIEVSR